MLSERTKEGLEKARANGKQIGRKEVDINVQEVIRRQEEGEILIDIASSLDVSKRTLQRRLAAYRRGDNNGRG